MMGVRISWDLAWRDTKFSIDMTQVTSLGVISIIGRNRTLDFPVWFPSCTACISPDQAGRSALRRSEVFQSTSRFAVRSWTVIDSASLYTMDDGGFISTFPALVTSLCYISPRNSVGLCCCRCFCRHHAHTIIGIPPVKCAHIVIYIIRYVLDELSFEWRNICALL